MFNISSIKSVAMEMQLPIMLRTYFALGELFSFLEIRPITDETSVTANTARPAASTPKKKYPCARVIPYWSENGSISTRIGIMQKILKICDRVTKKEP